MSANHFRALQQPIPMNARQLPEDEDEELTFDVYESPCTFAASNDEFTPQDIDAFEPCKNFYGGCVEESSVLDNDDSIKILDVAFDYELYYSVGSNITRTLAFFEGTMLEHISAVTGLTECDDRRLDVPELGDRRLPRYHDFSEVELLLFSGVTSEPVDQIDTHVGTCTVKVASGVKNGAICQPFNGLLRAYLKNNPPVSSDALISVQTGILKLIRYGMLQEALFASGNVKQAIFVGTRPDDSRLNGFRNQERSSSLNSSNNNNTNNTNGRAVGLIGGFAGVLVITLLVILFVVRNKNKKKVVIIICTPQDSCPDPMPGVTKSGSSTLDGSQESVEQPPSPHWLLQDHNQTQPREVFKCPKPPVSELTITYETSKIGSEPDQPSPFDQSLDMLEIYEDDDESTVSM